MYNQLHYRDIIHGFIFEFSGLSSVDLTRILNLDLTEFLPQIRNMRAACYGGCKKVMENKKPNFGFNIPTYLPIAGDFYKSKKIDAPYWACTYILQEP
jgi:hypothetical protein